MDKINLSYETLELTIDSMCEVIKNIAPVKKQRIEVCKKHYLVLAKRFGATKKTMTLVGSLYGIDVYTRPYLKKARIYTEK
jgi:hypothetical protein